MDRLVGSRMPGTDGGPPQRRVARLTRTLVALSLLAVPVAFAGSDKPYEVVDGKVDRATYLGWRTFNSACYMCHGTDARGTSVAPDLVARIKDMDPREFADAVLTRYRIVLPASKVSGDDQTDLRASMLDLVVKRERGELIMPAWGNDPNVKPHVMDIYSYLRARSDGALGPDRPDQLER